MSDDPKQQQLDRERFVELVAELLEGIQVPGSMGALGAAREPWVKLTSLLNLQGWVEKRQIVPPLRSLLGLAELPKDDKPKVKKRR